MSTGPEMQTLTEVRGDLVLAALCIGQFHAPCQIDDDRILVRADEALLQALDALGLGLRATVAVFTPVPHFAPEETVMEHVASSAVVRRAVRTHVSHLEDEEGGDEDATGPRSNA